MREGATSESRTARRTLPSATRRVYGFQYEHLDNSAVTTVVDAECQPAETVSAERTKVAGTPEILVTRRGITIRVMGLPPPHEGSLVRSDRARMDGRMRRAVRRLASRGVDAPRQPAVPEPKGPPTHRQGVLRPGSTLQKAHTTEAHRAACWARTAGAALSRGGKGVAHGPAESVREAMGIVVMRRSHVGCSSRRFAS